MATGELCPICNLPDYKCECVFSTYGGLYEDRAGVTPTDVVTARAIDVLSLLQGHANTNKCAVSIMLNPELQDQGHLIIACSASIQDLVASILETFKD
jgi:hypothetical protein